MRVRRIYMRNHSRPVVIKQGTFGVTQLCFGLPSPAPDTISLLIKDGETVTKLPLEVETESAGTFAVWEITNDFTHKVGKFPFEVWFSLAEHYRIATETFELVVMPSISGG